MALNGERSDERTTRYERDAYRDQHIHKSIRDYHRKSRAEAVRKKKRVKKIEDY